MSLLLSPKSVCLFLFYFYLYLKFLKNVIVLQLAVLTGSQILFISAICICYVHIFQNKNIKKQLGNVFIKYLNLFSKTALLKYAQIQHLIVEDEDEEDNDTESDVSDNNNTVLK